MSRGAGLLLATAILAAACSGDASEPAPTSATAPPTTRPITTTAVPETASPQAVRQANEPSSGGQGQEGAVFEARGIGDDYFPTLGNPGYDVDHYTLDLVYQPETGRLDGLATITATAQEALPVVNLDFASLDIVEVLIDGTAASFELVDEDLVVLPATMLVAGEDFTVEVEYGGTPEPARSGAVPFGIGWNSFGSSSYVVAEPDAAHTWFPSNDHPRDKATYTFRITVPDDVIAAANGTLVEQITDIGSNTWVWEMPFPMATYLATVVIGEFDVVEDTAASTEAGIRIRHVLPRGTTVDDWPGLDRQGEMVSFLEELFGPYPFDTYGIAIVDGFGAALENQTLSLFDRSITGSFFFEDVLIHELAHQWFGNSVSPGQWRDIWLNEGFASYAEWLWIERERGRAALEAEIAAERDFFAGAGLPPVGSPPSFDLFNAAVYRVGAMTLHALRLTVGDEAFFDILRTYAATHADRAVVTGDFIEVAETVSGLELDELFDSWLGDREIPDFP